MFKWFKQRVAEFFSGFRGVEPVVKPDTQVSKAPPLPQVRFERCDEAEKTPSNSTVRDRQFISVVYAGTPRWSLFQCPCGCGEVISLPMQSPHNPRWRLELSASGRPTLSPSVWRNKGCMSHFWIKDGRVFWCGDTGQEPWKVRPDVYSKRA